jgi:outer membrane protein assembly factor BamB
MGDAWISGHQGDPVVYIGSKANGVYALDPSSGKVRWNCPLSRGTSVCARGGVLIACGDRVSRIDEATGARLWSVPAAGSNEGEMCVANGVACVERYADSGRTVYAFDAETGRPRWKAGGALGSGVVASSDGAAVLTTTEDRRCVARSALTGKELWHQDNPSDSIHLASTPDGGFLIECEGTLKKCEAHTGHTVWAVNLGHSREAPFVTPTGSILATLDMDELCVVDGTTGRVTGRVNLESTYCELRPIVRVCGAATWGLVGDGAGHAFYLNVDAVLRAVELPQ